MSDQTQAEIPIGTPMRDAWEAYKQTEDFRNALRWAANPGHPDILLGSLWAMFVKGYEAADAELSALRQQIAERDKEIERLRGDYQRMTKQALAEGSVRDRNTAAVKWAYRQPVFQARVIQFLELDGDEALDALDDIVSWYEARPSPPKDSE